MEIREILLPEFDDEMTKTRTMLERVPEDRPDYVPHAKSMPLAKLAAHVAGMPALCTAIVEFPNFELTSGKLPRLTMESRAQLLAAFDESSQKARKAIAAASEQDWRKNWRFSAHDKTILEAPRIQAYRTMFMNHLVHHRAQLGVYLRLNDIPVPASYGPSADDRLGF